MEIETRERSDRRERVGGLRLEARGGGGGLADAMCQAGEEKKEKEKSEEEKNESVSGERKRKKEVPAEVEREAGGGGERHGCRWTVWTSKRQRPDEVLVGQQRDSPFAAPSRREAHM